MKKTKLMRTMCGMLSGLMICSFSNIAFAADTGVNMENPEVQRVIVDGVDITIDAEEEIYRARHGITDVETSDVMALSVEAEVGDGTPVEVYTTTRRIDAPTLTADGSEIYATTSVAVMNGVGKESTNYNTEYNVTAMGTIYWRDNSGFSNDFLGAYCVWNPVSGNPTITNRIVRMESYNTASDTVLNTFYPTSNSYSIGISQVRTPAFKFIMETRATVNSNTLKLRVATSMYD